MNIASTHAVSVTHIQVVLLDRYNEHITMINPFFLITIYVAYTNSEYFHFQLYYLHFKMCIMDISYGHIQYKQPLLYSEIL
jgi:hypothetical protein